jgi:hypothetical protein
MRHGFCLWSPFLDTLSEAIALAKRTQTVNRVIHTLSLLFGSQKGEYTLACLWRQGAHRGFPALPVRLLPTSITLRLTRLLWLLNPL